MAKICLDCVHCEVRKEHFNSPANSFKSYLQPHCTKMGYDVAGYDRPNEPICIEFKKRSEV